MEILVLVTLEMIKILVLIIMLIALFLLYRIAYPKQINPKKDSDIANEKPKTVPDVMGKSRFVLPDRSKPLQTPATSPENEKPEEKSDIFAAETEKKRSAVIPAEQLNEVFGDEPNLEILSLPLDDDNEIDFEAEEAEELRQTLGQEAGYADGMDYDDLENMITVVQEQPDEVSEETGRTLAALENTDMFEMLVSGDEGKMNWIKSVVERNIRNTMPEAESETADYGNFDIADIL